MSVLVIPSVVEVIPNTVGIIMPGADGRSRDISKPVSSRARTVGGHNVAELAGERSDAGLGAAEDQGVDVVGAFIGVDRLEVHHVTDHVVLVGDAVAAMHVAGGAGDVERLAAIVAL